MSSDYGLRRSSGRTDEGTEHSWGISLFAVKKTGRVIYIPLPCASRHLFQVIRKEGCYWSQSPAEQKKASAHWLSLTSKAIRRFTAPYRENLLQRKSCQQRRRLRPDPNLYLTRVP